MDLDINFDFTVPTTRQELFKIIYDLNTCIENLNEVLEKFDENNKTNITPCDITNISWLFDEKCKMLDNIKLLMESSKNNINLPTTDGEIFIELYKTLVNENIQQIQTLQQQTEQFNEQEKKLTELKNFLQILNSNQRSIETRERNGPKVHKIHLLKTQTMKKMQDTRNTLHKILDVYFKGTGLRDLIKDLTIAFFEGGDKKYVLAENYSYADVELLKKASLVVEDPYDKTRIKIDDII